MNTELREVRSLYTRRENIANLKAEELIQGIGTHAFSRIAYKRPENHDMFAATIGCDQKALVGSSVSYISKRRICL